MSKLDRLITKLDIDTISYVTHIPIGEVGLRILQEDPNILSLLTNNRRLGLTPGQKSAALVARVKGIVEGQRPFVLKG